MKKKIALTVVLGLLMGFLIYAIIGSISNLSYYTEWYNYNEKIYSQVIISNVIYLIGYLGCGFVIVVCLVHIWHKQSEHLKQVIVYTLEEYKKEREEKKELKKQIKLKKLENKIQKLNN